MRDLGARHSTGVFLEAAVTWGCVTCCYRDSSTTMQGSSSASVCKSIMHDLSPAPGPLDPIQPPSPPVSVPSGLSPLPLSQSGSSLPPSIAIIIAFSFISKKEKKTQLLETAVLTTLPSACLSVRSLTTHREPHHHEQRTRQKGSRRREERRRAEPGKKRIRRITGSRKEKEERGPG